ncbi:larval cuticle protein LCP-17-like [Onthophagus taurus]|uniref:larval cuticle protein LCP-17-like n=1 Tax=Onthophagus taurus TaxID=166361 RepID=UPI000C2089F1|nr:larval cuticle protein LCP-17-like [Onthophagus taurus]
MNALIILTAILACAAAQKSDKTASILRQSSDVNPDGSYQWSYENDNGISAQEQGSLTNSKEPAVAAQGGFQYKSPEGEQISIQYVADENGFQPQGAHLPVAPEPQPIPAYIARALDWIAAHPQPEEKPQRKF